MGYNFRNLWLLMIKIIEIADKEEIVYFIFEVGQIGIENESIFIEIREDN